MDPRIERLQNLTRRHFFKESQVGLGAIALSSMPSFRPARRENSTKRSTRCMAVARAPTSRECAVIAPALIIGLLGSVGVLLEEEFVEHLA